MLRLVAPRGSRRAFQVRDLLERNLLPVRSLDIEAEPEGAALLETLGIPPHETPVLVRNDGVLRNPSPAQRNEDVIVVGGGNSAGQAVLHLASARSVRVVVRGAGLASSMSRYLLDRIESAANVEVMTGTEVVAAHGDDRLEAVDLRDRDGRVERVEATTMFVMIGADPCTEAVEDMLAVDPAGYLLAGKGAAHAEGPYRWPLSDRGPHLLETVRPGIFTAGDVRAGSPKRVASAVGDGSLAVRFAYDVLAA